MHVLLDVGPLALLTHASKNAADVEECVAWFDALCDQDVRIYIPAISDYELRQELIRTRLGRGTMTGLTELNFLVTELHYLPLTKDVLCEAAGLCAQTRYQEGARADWKALDTDLILCAHARELEFAVGERPIIATTNPKQLEPFADARHWRFIAP